MIMSKLILNPRSRLVRADLRDVYEMHRTVMSGFPDANGDLGRVLFRLEVPTRTGFPFLLVQSEDEPNWGELSETGCLAEPVEWKPYDPNFVPGRELAFRLRANPTIKKAGKRRPVSGHEARLGWLQRKGATGGFELGWVADADEGYVEGRTKRGEQIQLLSVRFDGRLRVIDPEQFLDTLRRGIGSAKGLGFGLLSVALAT